MTTRSSKFNVQEKELEALVGIMMLKNTWRFEDLNIKFKKSPFQIKVLEKIFKITNFPSSKTRKSLSALLCMPDKSIQVWFQNTRQANKRSNLACSIEQTEIFDISEMQLIEIMEDVKASLEINGL